LCVTAGTAQDTAESHVKAALALKARGDPAAAKVELKEALALDPQLNAAHFFMAEILLTEDHPQQAIDELQSVRRSPSVDRLLGLSYLETGNAERAAFFFAHPTNAEGHYYLGIALGQLGQTQPAFKEFRMSVALQPRFGPAHESLALALRRLGDSTAALHEFQLAARYTAKNPVVLCDLGLALKGAGKLAEAEATLRSALALQPDFERARYALGIVLKMRGNDTDAAMQLHDVRQSHDIRTTKAQIRKLILDGKASLKANRPQDAKADFENARALDPSDPSPYYWLGLAEQKLDHFQAASDFFARAVSLKPDYAEAHIRLGILHVRASENAAALEELRTAVAADPDSAEAHYDLAKLFALLGRTEESIQELQESLAIDPAYFEALMLAGNLYAEHKEPERAAAAYQKILRLNPDSAEAHNNLGLVFLNAGKKDTAAEEFRIALRLKPDYRAAQYNLNLAIQRE